MKPQGANLNDAIHGLVRSMKRHNHHGPDRNHRIKKILSIIRDHDGAMAGELAKILDIRPSSMTEKLTSLEKEGFIFRQKDMNDQRISRVHITKKGLEHLHSFRKKDETLLNGILTAEEEHTFISLCNRLRQGIESGSDTE